VASWTANPRLVILGNPKAHRLSIVSFLVRHGELYLHHNFVVALLNDLFGIQARGGCSCAGPYGHRLLGIDLERSSRFREAIESGCEGVKPGWVRINFNYFISEETFEFILEAVHLIAQDGWKLLPLYEFEPETGLWRHRDRSRFAAGLGLDDVSYAGGSMQYRSRHVTEPATGVTSYLEEARRIVVDAGREQSPAGGARPLEPRLETLRWFALPGDFA
jgi:hypothetical protein